MHGWPSEVLKPLLYQVGRIEAVPMHYERTGAVASVWKNAFSIDLRWRGIRVGDRIGIDLGVDFDEQPIASIQLDGSTVDAGSEGMEVGVARGEGLPRLKVGMLVYRVKGD